MITKVYLLQSSFKLEFFKMNGMAVDFKIYQTINLKSHQILSGYIRQDGCIHFSITEYFHICGPENTEALSKILKGVFIGAHSMFQSPTYLCPEMESMFEFDESLPENEK